MADPYVHGYHPRESARLQDQAATLVDLLHSDTSYPPGTLRIDRLDRLEDDGIRTERFNVHSIQSPSISFYLLLSPSILHCEYSSYL
jgi:hypothetical protein